MWLNWFQFDGSRGKVLQADMVRTATHQIEACRQALSILCARQRFERGEYTLDLSFGNRIL